MTITVTITNDAGPDEVSVDVVGMEGGQATPIAALETGGSVTAHVWQGRTLVLTEIPTP